jgi:hypothetical protein
MKSQILGTITALYLGAAAMLGGCDESRGYMYKREMNIPQVYGLDASMDDRGKCYELRVGEFDNIKGAYLNGLAVLNTCVDSPTLAVRFIYVPEDSVLKKVSIEDLEKVAKELRNKPGVRL